MFSEKLKLWRKHTLRTVVLLDILEEECCSREFMEMLFSFWCSSESYEKGEKLGDSETIMRALVPLILNNALPYEELKDLLERKVNTMLS